MTAGSTPRLVERAAGPSAPLVAPAVLTPGARSSSSPEVFQTSAIRRCRREEDGMTELRISDGPSRPADAPSEASATQSIRCSSQD